MHYAVVILSIIFLVPQARAEFRCGTEVTYSWKPESEDRAVAIETDSATPGKDAKKEAEKAEPMPVADKMPEVSLWAKLEKRAETEAEAKHALQQQADRERSRAVESCIRRHQNLSGCISSKMSAYQNTIANLTFTARAKLEDSIVTDCSNAQGECLGAKVAEIKCEDLAPPAEEGEEEDSKKKKKK